MHWFGGSAEARLSNSASWAQSGADAAGAASASKLGIEARDCGNEARACGGGGERAPGAAGRGDGYGAHGGGGDGYGFHGGGGDGYGAYGKGESGAGGSGGGGGGAGGAGGRHMAHAPHLQKEQCLARFVVSHHSSHSRVSESCACVEAHDCDATRAAPRRTRHARRMLWTTRRTRRAPRGRRDGFAAPAKRQQKRDVRKRQLPSSSSSFLLIISRLQLRIKS